MSTSPTRQLDDDRVQSIRLPRSLSAIETWGFGLTGHFAWMSTAPALNAALGPSAIFVLLPAVIVACCLNLQVRQLGEHWHDVAGGTPNYLTRLLKHYPRLARYAAIAYFLSWAAFPAVNAIVLTDLIKANLAPSGVAFPETLLRIGFTLIPFVVAFSGTRALSILHVFFILPATSLLLLFCLQGIGWLAFSPSSPGFFPSHWPGLSLVDWAKWMFFSIYAAYACESSSAFVADSHRPERTLKFLNIAAWLIPLIYLGGSWVLIRLAASPGVGDSPFLSVLAASKPFWAEAAPWFVTFLLTCSCLLGSTTAVSNSPRILHQLALDKQISPVFAFVSPRGVLGPALVLVLLLSLICLAWGNVTRIVLVTGTGWLVAMMTVHFGLWLYRGRSKVRWARWSLGFFSMEVVVLVLGGLAWGWNDVLMGLLCPAVILAVDATLAYIPLPFLRIDWWARQRQVYQSKFHDFTTLQVLVLLILVCVATAIGWGLSEALNQRTGQFGSKLLIVLLMSLSLVAVAVACWTTLPQAAAIAEAREQAEQQAEWERLLGKISHRIRQSLNLDEILATTVAEVRQFLRTDRVLIYRIQPDGIRKTVVESVVAPRLGVLGTPHATFYLTEGETERYRKSQTQVFDNVYTAGLSPQHLKLLAALQVTASLAVPIMREDELWGLLVTHQCSSSRHWQRFEIEILQQLATQVGIAIQQSELYRQVQQLNAELERKVQRRTSQLQQAFDAEATLKRITDKVRDSLDETQILQTAVRELALGLQVSQCNAAIFDGQQDPSTSHYTYTAKPFPGHVSVLQVVDGPTIQAQLLQQQYFQFCPIVSGCGQQMAMLACPIVDNQGVMGHLLLTYEAIHTVHEREIRLVQQVANQCAIALRQSRLYQAAQVQVKELEKLNQLKDDFLSTVSHELRTPMASIKMATQMLEILLKQTGMLDADSGKAARYFQILRNECQREIDLVNNLLNLSQIDATPEQFATSTIQLRQQIQAIATPFEERLKTQQQQLQIELPDQLPLINTNSSHLEQILRELLSNACKYTPAKEQIIMTASATVDRVSISVLNTGVEISASEIPKVFDKFYRIPNNDPWKHGGTGLGLALAKKMADQIGGTIQVESALGQTCFTLTLPITPSGNCEATATALSNQ